MATKEPKDETVINNLVGFINRDYEITNNDGEIMKIHANPNLNGWELWLYRVNGGGVEVMLTQYEQIPGKMAILILKMLYWDILQRSLNYGYYSIKRRV